jgi:hypothetical protein
MSAFQSLYIFTPTVSAPQFADIIAGSLVVEIIFVISLEFKTFAERGILDSRKHGNLEGENPNIILG